MLVELIVKLALDLATWALSFVPDVTVPSFDFSAAVSWALFFDAGLPIHEAITALGVVVLVIGSLWLFGLLRELISHIPFVGGGG